LPSRAKIYTKTGDLGETLLCDGSKTSKDSQRVDAYGTIDELNSFVGLAIVKNEYEDLKNHLMEVQKDLHAIGSNLAFPADLSQASIKGPSISSKIPRITEETIARLEKWIDDYDNELPELKRFILCGGSETSALLHVARTVCRRAERKIVSLKKHEEVNKNLLRYINRLSAYFFMAARVSSHRAGKSDIEWRPE